MNAGTPPTFDPIARQALQQLSAPELAQRHLGWIGLFAWVRGAMGEPADAVARLERLAAFMEADNAARQHFALGWAALHREVDVRTLLAEQGFSQRAAFPSALVERLQRKWLPATPETRDPVVLFGLALSHERDAAWLSAVPDALAARLVALTQHSGAALQWRAAVADAITFCISQVRAVAFSSEVRLRMAEPVRDAQAFHLLDAAFDAVRDAVEAGDTGPRLTQAVGHLRELLATCRGVASNVYGGLAEQGVSVGLVFRLREMRERLQRIRELLEVLLSPQAASPVLKLLARFVQLAHDQRSVRSLLRQNSSLLAAKVTERSAETGEHYITRDRAEYRDMLRRAAGGGALMSLTTAAKFGIGALGLSMFWTGLFAGLNYALTFVVIQLLHWTVATKQPAMTAPAMAARLRDLHDDKAVEGFVDEVSHLVRSQVAAVAGNLALVAPAVLVLSGLMSGLWGRPMIDAATADYVLHSLTLLGPTALFAAFTGILLFASSVIAGWVENWFVLHRLDSALRYNPRITAALGEDRARRWARFWRDNISGFAANVSLGLMLGLIPAVAGFLGLSLEVRHVTLSTGQVAAAVGQMGWQALLLPALWWCIAGLVVTGVLNVGVSFFCAFRVAMLATGITGVNRDRVYASIRARLRRQPLSFLLPPPGPTGSPPAPADRSTPGGPPA